VSTPVVRQPVLDKVQEEPQETEDLARLLGMPDNEGSSSEESDSSDG
jgi:hypothetical protein